MAITTTPSADRPLYKRLTVVAGTILAAINYLESQQFIPPGTGTHIATLIEHASALLMGLGVYRHIPTT